MRSPKPRLFSQYLVVIPETQPLSRYLLGPTVHPDLTLARAPAGVPRHPPEQLVSIPRWREVILFTKRGLSTPFHT